MSEKVTLYKNYVIKFDSDRASHESQTSEVPNTAGYSNVHNKALPNPGMCLPQISKTGILVHEQHGHASHYRPPRLPVALRYLYVFHEV